MIGILLIVKNVCRQIDGIDEKAVEFELVSINIDSPTQAAVA